MSDTSAATVQSKGGKMIRVQFNPEKRTEVDDIKMKFAELIDIIETHAEKDPRLASIAQIRTEEAAMWAVKALTA